MQHLNPLHSTSKTGYAAFHKASSNTALTTSYAQKNLEKTAIGVKSSPEHTTPTPEKRQSIGQWFSKLFSSDRKQNAAPPPMNASSRENVGAKEKDPAVVVGIVGGVVVLLFLIIAPIAGAEKYCEWKETRARYAAREAKASQVAKNNNAV